MSAPDPEKGKLRVGFVVQIFIKNQALPMLLPFCSQYIDFSPRTYLSPGSKMAATAPDITCVPG